MYFTRGDVVYCGSNRLTVKSGLSSPTSQTSGQKNLNSVGSVAIKQSVVWFLLPSARFHPLRQPPRHDILAQNSSMTLDYQLSLILRSIRSLLN